MRKWLSRVLALGSVSLALPLLVAPFHTSYTEDTTDLFVQFEPRPALDAAQVEKEHGTSVQVIVMEDLGRFPAVEDRLASLDPANREFWLHDDFGEWITFQMETWGGVKDTRLVSFRDSLILVTAESDDQAERSGSAQFRYLGELPAKRLPVITPEQVAGLPGGRFALERGEGGPLGIPSDAWDEFAPSVFPDEDSAQVFSYEGEHYQRRYEFLDRTETVTVPGLGTGLRLAGLLLLALGVYYFRNLYSIGPGVAVNPRWVAILWDGIVLPFTVLAGFLTADAAIAKLFSVPPLVNDEYGTFMGIFFFVFSLPVVAAYLTRFTVQTVRTDDAGVYVKGLGGVESIQWADLNEIGFSDEYVAVGRAGHPVPRKLQRQLSLESRSGRKIFVNEPQVRSAKDAVTDELTRHAPESWKDRIRESLRNW